MAEAATTFLCVENFQSRIYPHYYAEHDRDRWDGSSGLPISKGSGGIWLSFVSNSFVSFSGGGPLSLKGVVFMKNHGINGEDSW